MKIYSVLFVATTPFVVFHGANGFTPSSSTLRTNKAFSIQQGNDKNRIPIMMTRTRTAMSTSTTNEQDPAAKKEAEVTRMVNDDEWDGVTMKLTEAVCQSVMESVSTKTKDFIGKENYSVGDITKEVDLRIKNAVAKMRGKDNYEIGDLISYATEQGIAITEQATGKKLETATELSKSIDAKVKNAVKSYTGKDTYEAGDLAKAVSSTVTTRAKKFATAYELDQVAAEIIQKRKEWARKYLGEEFTEHFTWTQLANRITGKETYQFGDVTKKAVEETKKYVDNMLHPKPAASKPTTTDDKPSAS